MSRVLDNIPHLALTSKSLAGRGVSLFFFVFSLRAFIVQASHTAATEDMVAGGVSPYVTMFVVELWSGGETEWFLFLPASLYLAATSCASRLFSPALIFLPSVI